ncbi:MULTISPECIES: 5'-nucleotidase C-terminal domain-containing protein [unclassified Rhizobium]|uniref:5'-nucleotidase C-terminal domain-containing protein n=1 Tax=unclassified Rhizobium TaxID=2613769 RepID=UPI00160EC8F5|nr:MULTISPECIES: 5'-nucleotidase C-terminal domain-containing protein [unclassified Rhizobium]MBB3290062.1 5'-nucleotidase [Rhizobium sp. BK252]MBB3404844.1 5'-nucleotidase [Rhizobium sp. BK289]MBB3417278.1 5'-nucleotidase [Rhizobium sp. BK284]MBB3485420.1 5'-nucleotidase [Rhizobium sp. BK347]MDK4722561.1 5'-nucleotidase C-terminal domain-containing protein [Rhizobium sp. CNPSo 3968]
MKQPFGVGLLAATLLALSTSAAFADYQLNILHFNDFHSRVESINKFDATCSAAEEAKNECFGGAARLKTIIDQRRAALAGQNVLVLDAGDNFQGSLFYTTYKGAAEVEFLNAVKIDAMTVGNHEFDDGEGPLAAFLDKAQFPVVTANLVVDDQSKLGERIKKSIVLDVGGQKIGIVGAVTTETPELASPGPHVKITDDAAAISAEVDALKSQGINKIIALTHVGYPRDVEKIAKIAGVSIVVGGHSHTLLSNTDPKAAGPYPTMVDNPAGYKVPVVQAASYGKYLGDLVVTFDDNGIVKDAKGDPILLDASIKPDPAIAARVQEMAKPIEELRKKVIGSSQGPIEGAREVCRVQECSMGNLVADAMLDRTKTQGISIAIQNGGGLRASIGAGDVSMGDVLTVLPFQNTIATFQLTGAEVKAALENGLSQIDEGAGRFPQVAGLKYSFDKTKPAGSRLVSVEVQEGTEFKPIDPEKTYGIVSNNYMRAGGDGYAVFAKDGKNAYDFGPNLESVVADYLGAHNPYKPYTDGRITQVGTVAATAQPAPAKPADATQQAAPEQKPAPAADGGAASSTTPPASSPPTVTTPSTTMPTNPTATPSTPPKSDPAASTPATAAPATETPATSAPATSAPAATTPETTAPAAAASEPPKTPTTTPTTHVIVAGDTLWDIAKTYYGNANQWHKLVAANRNIKPHHLTIGEKLRVPTK